MEEKYDFQYYRVLGNVQCESLTVLKLCLGQFMASASNNKCSFHVSFILTSNKWAKSVGKCVMLFVLSGISNR